MNKPIEKPSTMIMTPALSFRAFRERTGLSHEEVARRAGISSPCVWDIESRDEELLECYSPAQMRQFSDILGIHPIELFGGDVVEPPITAVELIQLIRDQCQSRGITLEQFEDVVGWRLSACIESPERLLTDISIHGLQWLCRELGIDWRRVILGL